MAEYKIIKCPYCESPLVVNTNWKTRKCNRCGTRLRANMHVSQPLDGLPIRNHTRGIKNRGLYRSIEVMHK